MRARSESARRFGFLALGAVVLLGAALAPRPARADLLFPAGGPLLRAAQAAVLAQSPTTQASPSPGRILRVLSVGSVLTEDGTIWQYLPDRERWVTIDESFRLQKQQTQILPLPVPTDEIAGMETFGFILTTTGDCWLYDIHRNRWEKLPVPQR